MGESGQKLVSRISISLPEELLVEVDRMVEARGYASRSHAVNDVLHRALAEHHGQGSEVMVGTITLFYDHDTPGLQARLARLQHDNIAEVISSLHVHLVQNQTMEVILVQGPADKLQAVADQLVTQRGIISGRLTLVASLMPPVHPFA